MKSLHPNENSSSNWHRDARGRQLKMMIYLTDVTEEDSNFSLLPTTHHGNYARKSTYQESRFSDAEVKDMSISPQEWLGNAGDAQLFDTNLIHRLRRKLNSAVRDTVTFYYTPGQAMTRLDMPSVDLGPATEALFADPDWPLKRVYYS